jgi:uncharacterized protein YkwD
LKLFTDNMPNLFPGRSLNAAQSILANQTVRQQVSASNRSDLFSFSLSGAQQLNLRFKSSGRSSQIRLIQDRNQNGFVDSGELLKQVAMRPRKFGSIRHSAQPSELSGTFYVQVVQTGAGSSRYQFRLSPKLGGKSQPESEPSAEIVNQIVALTNSFRQQNGLAAVTFNSRLTRAAQTHAQNMALQDFVSHTGADGSDIGQRISATGYQWSVAAENIAAGYLNAATVVQGWIDSPSHRVNLLDPAVTEIGVGYYFLANDAGNQVWTHYWTQVFSAPV